MYLRLLRNDEGASVWEVYLSVRVYMREKDHLRHQ